LRGAARLERDAASRQDALRPEKEKTPLETPLADAS